MNQRDYSEDEAQAILKRAIDHQDGGDVTYSRDQLYDMGREMGLSQEAIVKAEKEMALKVGPFSRTSTSNKTISPEEAAFRRERRNQLYLILAIYLATVAFVFLLNWLSGGLSFPWFLFVAGGGAVGVVAYYLTEGVMQGEGYEKAFTRWVEKQKRNNRGKNF